MVKKSAPVHRDARLVIPRIDERTIIVYSPPFFPMSRSAVFLLLYFFQFVLSIVQAWILNLESP